MLEFFFPKNIGKMLVQFLMKNVGSTFLWKMLLQPFFLKNVVTFVGKMLPPTFHKKCWQTNVGNNPEKCWQKIVGNNPKNVDEKISATIPKNIEEKNIDNVYEKCWKIIGNFSEKCWRKNVGTTSKMLTNKICNISIKWLKKYKKRKMLPNILKTVATFKKSWQKMVAEINIS
jgi:hypothetical protein